LGLSGLVLCWKGFVSARLSASPQFLDLLGELAQHLDDLMKRPIMRH
jgi:hypothetical protein